MAAEHISPSGDAGQSDCHVSGEHSRHIPSMQYLRYPLQLASLTQEPYSFASSAAERSWRNTGVCLWMTVEDFVNCMNAAGGIALMS